MPSKNIDALVCDLLGGCSVEGSDVISSVRIGDSAHHIHPSAERVVTLVDSISGKSRWISDTPRTSGSRVLFIFQKGFQPCGEIHTDKGSFRRAVMTGSGEEVMGDRLREWQVRGVPRVLFTDDLSSLIETRIPLRYSSAHIVLVLWLGSQGFRVIDAPSVLLGVWQNVIHRTPTDEGRFKMMEKATSLSLPELAELFTEKPPKPLASKKIPVRKVRA